MSQPAPVPTPEIIFVARALPDGTQVLVPRTPRPRSCVRLDGTEKIVYDARSDAARGCPKHMTYYRCRACGSWHRATNRKKGNVRETWPGHAAWVRKAA
jgi:hypothetical protein